MENRRTSSMVISSQPSEQTGMYVVNANMNSTPLSPQQSLNLSQGHLAILWDMENCSVPSDVRPEDVAGNIRKALRVHPVITGAVTMFSAYGDFNAFPRRLREGCQRTGVKLIDVPNGRKDAADKAILIDMFLFALDNPPPSSIMLISGDVDFAPALHILGQRGYSVILVIPSGVGVSSALCNAGNFVWDWPSVARGEGFLPPARTSTHFHGDPKDLASYFLGCHINDNANGQNEEEAIVYRGISQKFSDTLDFSMVSQSLTEYNSTSGSIPSCSMTSRSRSPPSVINEVSDENLAPCDQNNSNWVQPGDLNVLKDQLVKLLELSGGCVSVTRVPKEYQKIYGRPLYISEYGALELVDLLKKKEMSDSLGLSVKGEKRHVYLRNSRGAQKSPSFVLSKKERKGKGAQKGNTEIMAGTWSSEDCSDEERVVIEPNERTGEKSSSQMEAHSPCDQNNSIWVQPGDLNVLKGQLVKLLELYGGCVSVTRVPKEYKKIYGRPLYISEYGALELVDLLKKKEMSDSLGLSVKGEKRLVYLRNSRGAQKSPSFVLSKKKRKGKGVQKDNTEIMAGRGSLEDCSDEERVVIEPNERTGEKSSSQMEAHSPCDQNNSIWVQPGDLNVLKGQLVKLLELYGGCVSVTRVPKEYKKIYGRPLYISEYGALELVDLLKKKEMSDSLGLSVKGEKRLVYLRNSRGAQKSPSFVLSKKKRKGKGVQKGNTEIMAGRGSLEDCSDEERVVIEPNERTGEKSSSQMEAHSPCDQNNSIWVQPGDLNVLKGQLVKLLELYGGCVSVTRVPKEYKKIYGRPLYISEYGALELVDLLKKKEMSDSLGLSVKGEKRLVYLRNSRGAQKSPSFVLSKKKRKGKGVQKDNTEIMAGRGSLEDCSDEERVVIEPNERTGEKSSSQMEAHSPCDQNNSIWVQPGDLNVLKGQLVKLLELYGGRVSVTRVPKEYKKIYGRPLYISEYGALELVDLLKKKEMSDSLGLSVKGEKRLVYLRNSRGSQKSPSFVLSKKKRKGKGVQKDNTEIMAGRGSLQDCSDEERVVIEAVCSASQIEAHSQMINQSIDKFKLELQEILVSYTFPVPVPVFMVCFEAIYEQRYKKPLAYQSFGVNVLEELLEKVKDVVAVQEEPASKRKFLVAVGG